MKSFYYTLFFALILILPDVATPRDSGILFLRGRVEAYATMRRTHDGVWFNSNGHQSFFIKLYRHGRLPSSFDAQDKTFLDNKTLLAQKVELIQIEAP